MTVLLALAVAVIPIRIWLTRFPEILPGGARYGEVVNDLAVAYVGAFIFNVLIVVMPSVRRDEGIVQATYRVLASIYARANEMEREIAAAAGITPPELGLVNRPILDAGLTREQLENAFSTFRREDASPKEVGNILPDGSLRVVQLTWHAWAVSYAQELERQLSDLSPFLGLLPTSTASQITEIAYCNWIQNYRRDERLGLSMHLTRGVVASGGEIYDYIQATRRMWSDYVSLRRELGLERSAVPS